MKTCEQCKHFECDEQDTVGFCIWAQHTPMPPWATEVEGWDTVDRDDTLAEGCECFGAKAQDVKL